MADYGKAVWGTYKQWQDAGAHVRKGEKSSFIVFYKQFETGDTDDEKDQTQRRSMMAKASRVFNIAQVDGYDLPAEPEPSENLVYSIASADEFIARTGAIIYERGDCAYFNPTTDEITMPDRHRFFDTESGTATEHFHSVQLHELTHNAASLIMPRGRVASFVFRHITTRLIGIIKAPRDKRAAHQRAGTAMQQRLVLPCVPMPSL